MGKSAGFPACWILLPDARQLPAVTLCPGKGFCTLDSLSTLPQPFHVSLLRHQRGRAGCSVVNLGCYLASVAGALPSTPFPHLPRSQPPAGILCVTGTGTWTNNSKVVYLHAFGWRFFPLRISALAGLRTDSGALQNRLVGISEGSCLVCFPEPGESDAGEKCGSSVTGSHRSPSPVSGFRKGRGTN